MQDKKFDINNLRVASPCSVGWETMSGDERTRHCQLCNLSVYNISALTDREACDLVTKKEGRLCVRFYRRSDGTVLTADCPVGIRALRKKAARVATAAFATVLGLFSISYGQKEDKNVVDARNAAIVRTAISEKLSQLTGILTDPQAAVIPGVTLRLSAGNSHRTVVSDNTGSFIFDNVPAGIYDLSAKTSVFMTYELKNLTVNDREKLELNIELKPDPYTELIGVLAIVDEIRTEIEIDPASNTVRNVIIPRKIIPIPHK